MADFRMPSLGADMEDAVVIEWLVQPGSGVKRGDVVAVVETDKGAIEIEMFNEGIIDQINVPVGQKVSVDTVLATYHDSRDATSIDAADGNPRKPDSPPEIPPTAPPEAPPDETPESPPMVPPELPPSRPPEIPPAAPPELPVHESTQADQSSSTERLRISSFARRRAEALGVDATQLREFGTGYNGAVTAFDVDKFARSAKLSHATQTLSPVNTQRRSLGRAMLRSKREIPHYYLSTTVDMSYALDWLRDQNELLPVAKRMLYSVLLIKAVAKALEKYPELNGYWLDDEFVPSQEINLAIAIALREGGLVAPSINGANTLDLEGLMTAFRDLVNRARGQKLRASELSSPTMTISNLGEQGVDVVFPIIFPPQVAIVGFGAVMERPWVQKGEVTVRRLLVASLAGDHRASDGRRGGLFLATVSDLLQHPEAL